MFITPRSRRFGKTRVDGDHDQANFDECNFDYSEVSQYLFVNGDEPRLDWRTILGRIRYKLEDPPDCLLENRKVGIDSRFPPLRY
jgi:hypothetical protein